VTPPTAVLLRRGADDDGCLRELRDGTSDAAVTTTKLAGDLDAAADIVVVGEGPVLTERRSMLIPTGAAGDALRAAVNEVLAAALDDGTLGRFSAQRFGGEDLTVAPQP
jgi:ABC-type amino acid transport substrate-binding protein